MSASDGIPPPRPREVAFVFSIVSRKIARYYDSAAAVSICENDWAPNVKFIILTPFLPYNAIGVMLKFEIIGGRGPPQNHIN